MNIYEITIIITGVILSTLLILIFISAFNPKFKKYLTSITNNPESKLVALSVFFGSIFVMCGIILSGTNVNEIV